MPTWVNPAWLMRRMSSLQPRSRAGCRSVRLRLLVPEFVSVFIILSFLSNFGLIVTFGYIVLFEKSHLNE